MQNLRGHAPPTGSGARDAPHLRGALHRGALLVGGAVHV